MAASNFVCGKCGKVAKTKQALERHAAYHEDDRPFSCEVCLQRFKNSDDRGKHYRRLKRDGKFAIACKACHKHFKTVELLNKHVEMLGCKVDGFDVEAEVSQFPVETVAIVDNNEVDHSDIRTTQVVVKEESLPGDGIACTCKICEAEFIGSSFLKAHYKEVHKDSKKQVCIQCGQTLSSKDSLARHFSIFHQTSFPYSCNICNQKFKIKESLCRHVKFVHQNSGYPCTECQRVFTQPVNLKKHMAVHSSQKEYVCHVCGREFRWKQALQKHEALHGQSLNGQKSCEKMLTNENIEDEHFEEGLLNKSNESILDDRSDVKLEVVSQVDANEFELQVCNEHDESDDLVHPSEVNSMQTNELVDNNRFDTTTSKRYTEKTVENRQSAKQSIDTYEFIDDDDSDLDELRIKVDTDVRKNVVFKRKGFCIKDHERNAAEKRMKLSETEPITSVDDNDKESGMVVRPDFEGEVKIIDSAVKDLSEDSENKINNVNLKRNENTRHSETTRNIENMGNIENDENMNNNDNNRDIVSDDSRKIVDSVLPRSPMNETENGPRFVFKPSSIQNLMSKSNKVDTIETDQDIDKDVDNIETPAVVVRKPIKSMKFPNNSGTLGQSLHNPFLIGDTRKSLSPLTILPRKKYFRADRQMSVNTDSNRSPESIPSGKFSMVKHMLTLKNEENFDKNVFENPLYNKLPEVKDFNLFVERHKITEKNNDRIVEKYDLSGKQNIPFHWLGMSIPKPRLGASSLADSSETTGSPDTNGQTSDIDVDNNIEMSDRIRAVSMAPHTSTFDGLGDKSCVTTDSPVSSDHSPMERDLDASLTEYAQDLRGLKTIERDAIADLSEYAQDLRGLKAIERETVANELVEYGKDPRGFRAMRSLVSLKKRSGAEMQLITDPNTSSGYSVLSNPFVKHTDDISSNMTNETSADKTTSVDQCSNMLKRSTAIFGAMSRMHDSTPVVSATPPSWTINSRSHEEIDTNLSCNNDSNGSYPRYMSDKHSQNMLHSEASVASPRCPPNSSVCAHIPHYTSAHTSHTSTHDSIRSLQDAPLNRSISIPSCDSSNLSALPRYRSDSHLTGFGQSSFYDANQELKFPNHSLEGLSAHSAERSKHLFGLSPGDCNESSIPHNIKIPQTSTGIGMHTPWSVSRSTSANDNQLPVHLAVSAHGHTIDKHYSHMQRINKEVSGSPQNKLYHESHLHMSPFSPPRVKSSQGGPVLTNQSELSSPGMFNAAVYTELPQHVVSSDFKARQADHSLMTPVYSLPHSSNATNLSTRSQKFSAQQTDPQKHRHVPSILDFCFKRNSASVQNKTNDGPAIEGRINIARPGVHEQHVASTSPASNERTEVSIFDILKGPSEKPKQLENVDYLLDAYV